MVLSLKCAMWNITSIVNKTEIIMEHLLDRNPEIVFLSETWMKADKDNVTALVKTFGYTLVHNRRKNRQKELGGGVGFLLNSRLQYKRINQKDFSSFEHITIKLLVKNGTSVILVSIYRVLFVPVTIFLEEIIELFEILLTLSEYIIIAGDINIHMEENELYSNRFKDILGTFNITQHVDLPTHVHGHTLDVILTFSENPHISNLSSEEYDVSHHFLIDFYMDIIPEKIKYKTISFRNTKNINVDQMKNTITDRLHISDDNTFKDSINCYNRVLQNLLDEHAPLKSREIKIVPDAPWFDWEYENLRKLRRKAEKQYRKTGLTVHKENFINLRKQTTNLASRKKHSYYSDKLNTGGSKVMYSVVNKLLDNDQEVVLPESDNDELLANNFMVYFTEKIDKLRSKFSKETDISSLVAEGNVNENLVTFEKATRDEILQIVSSFGIKCSPDDPIPANLLKQNAEFFIPFWTELVNISLSQGSMDCLKGAILKPLIKELDEKIDRDNYKNYRPVSNLLFVGKLIERVVSIRLNKHMTDNNLHIESQYGYKKGHSTETLLLKIMDNLLNACDHQIPAILMLLDLSAAFDTVDQDKLLMILHKEIGIDGIALKWFNSFLKGRNQKVQVGKSYSTESGLKFGIPQGSVLGPVLFNIYIRSFCKQIEQTKFLPFGFADDHQLLKTFLPILQVNALGDDLRHCFETISKWMNQFFLCLNPGKTKVLVIAPPALRSEIVIRGTFLSDKCVRFVDTAKNLGVILDNELTFAPQITKVVQSCFLVIRNLSKIKSFLNFTELHTLVNACIFSRIDYCNSLYFGVNSSLITKLQSVQNSAARLLRTKGGLNNTSLDQFMRKCHWLKVKERIFFKICLIVHKCLYDAAPGQLKELISYCSSSRTMQLNQHTHKGSFGNRCFSRIAPKLWNLLPINIRIERKCNVFKKLLKTYLFDNFEKLSQKLFES